MLAAEGAAERVAEIESELLLASKLTTLREQAGFTPARTYQALGSVPTTGAGIERPHNVTIDVLEQYVRVLGGFLEVNVVKDKRRVRLLGAGEGSRAKSA